MSAKAIIIAGYGLNCEEESQVALNYVGMDADIIHVNDLIDNPALLKTAQLMLIPGGFSYGDDTGSGNGLAQKMKLALWDDIRAFVERDTLTIGICNGCQIANNLGLTPAFDGEYGDRVVAATYNASARYQCRWIDMKVNPANTSPWLNGIESMHIPVAHGEGRFMMSDETLAQLKSSNQIAFKYVKPDGSPTNEEFPFNPNGSIADIGGITDSSGRVLTLMPHPERGMFTWQRDDYAELKDAAQREGRNAPELADGMALFQNAAAYFEVAQKKSA
jgi:phosphoribosylformylglycinamidine synthase I